MSRGLSRPYTSSRKANVCLTWLILWDNIPRLLWDSKRGEGRWPCPRCSQLPSSLMGAVVSPATHLCCYTPEHKVTICVCSLWSTMYVWTIKCPQAFESFTATLFCKKHLNCENCCWTPATAWKPAGRCYCRFEMVNDVNIEVIEGLGVVESREHCRNARPGNTFHQHSGGLEPGHFPTNTPTTRLLCRLPQTIDFLDCKA